MKAIIEDTLSPDTNPYGLAYSRVDDPGANQTITVTWTTTPATCTGVRIDALDSNGALVGSSGTLAATSPAVWSTCPDGDHTFLFFFLIPVPGDDEYFVLNDIEGITDELTPSGDPFHLVTDNNQEDKLAPIVGTKLLMQFMSDSNNNLNKLLRGTYSDRRYRTTLYINDLVVFRGFLQMADAEEAFLPHANTIRLTATCGLGSLKNKALVNASDANPSGYYRLIEFIAFCLRLTGVERNINVVMNIKEVDFAPFTDNITFVAGNTIILDEGYNVYTGQVLRISGTVSNDGDYNVTNVTSSLGNKTVTLTETVVNEGPVSASVEFLDNNFFNYLYSDAKTWETEPGESEDGYTVLERILKPICRIGQRHGEWWIKNTDEFDDQGDYVVVFDSSGNWVENKAVATYEKEIGINENMKWSQHSCIVGFKSPAQFAKLTYRYENPKEVPCNKDFERGDYIADIDADSKKYELECWDLYKQGGSGDEAPDTDGYIRRDFVGGVEDARYLVIEHDAAAHFFRSEPIPVEARSKITFDMIRRMSADVGGSGFYRDVAMQIRLYADDGTYYHLRGETSAGDTLLWQSTNSSFTTNVVYLYFEGDVSRDMTEAESIYGTKTSPEIPKAGYLRILMHQSHETSWNRDTYIDRLDFTYLPYINGAHDKFTGHQHKVSQGSNVEEVDEEVYISDSPAKLPKGALIKNNYSDYELSEQFWNASVFPSGPPSDDYKHPYLYICAFNVWNQVWMLQRIFRGSIQGIESDSTDALGRSDLPGIFHTYRMRDTDEQTNDKKFMLLSYDMDLRRCEFSQATFIQVHDEITGKRYTDTYEFKYLTQ